MRLLTLTLIPALFLCSFSLSAYYNADEKQELEFGSLSDRSLMRTLKKISSKKFHALGYKRRAKKALFGSVDLERDEKGYFVTDVYCLRKVRNSVGPNKIPRNRSMNVEHTWPQSKGSKREPARGDLHHLFPSDNKANSARGNFPFSEVRGKDAHRTCDASQRGRAINPKTKKEIAGSWAFQPPYGHRGNVARAMFYVRAKYGYKLSSVEEFYLRKWHKEDPVDSAEIKRNDKIQQAQGNRNPFIDYPELVNRISDF